MSASASQSQSQVRPARPPHAGKNARELAPLLTPVIAPVEDPTGESIEPHWLPTIDAATD
jgi:hypothetical protein